MFIMEDATITKEVASITIHQGVEFIVNFINKRANRKKTKNY